jgi:hypothetical protein
MKKYIYDVNEEVEKWRRKSTQRVVKEGGRIQRV